MTEIVGWPNGARLAMSFVVNVEEGSEMNPAEGDRGPEAVDELGVVLKKPIRNFGNESNYQYGIKAGAPRVMALLARYGVTRDVHGRRAEPRARPRSSRDRSSRAATRCAAMGGAGSISST